MKLCENTDHIVMLLLNRVFLYSLHTTSCSIYYGEYCFIKVIYFVSILLNFNSRLGDLKYCHAKVHLNTPWTLSLLFSSSASIYSSWTCQKHGVISLITCLKMTLHLLELPISKLLYREIIYHRSVKRYHVSRFKKQ